MIFLVQFVINKHSQIFQRLQIPLALRARAIFLKSLKNMFVLIYSKLYSKSFDYLYELHSTRSNYYYLLYTVVTISILIGQEPPAYFENSHDFVDKHDYSIICYSVISADYTARIAHA